MGHSKRILRAKNDAATRPAINISIAKAYLVGSDPKLVARTWGDAIKHYCSGKKETTRLRMEREYNKPVYKLNRILAATITEGELGRCE